MIRGGRSFEHTYEIEIKYESQWMEILLKNKQLHFDKIVMGP